MTLRLHQNRWNESLPPRVDWEVVRSRTRQMRWAETGGVGTMKRLIIAVSCILLASPAVGQSVGEKTGINSVLGVAPTTADFVKEVAISDMFEVESNKLAQQ